MHVRRIVQFARRLGLYLTVAVLGFVVGVVALYVSWARSGPSLQPWHTEELTAEFTAARADEIRTFDDYRRLEDTLFEQLDARIYALTETGPSRALARYSTGSAVDPRGWAPDWNRSFELPADGAAGGVLLLHGMSDSPYSLRALGEGLNDRGFRVVGLRLPGHGTAPSGFLSVTWEEMAATVRLAAGHAAPRVKGGTGLDPHRRLLHGSTTRPGLRPGRAGKRGHAGAGQPRPDFSSHRRDPGGGAGTMESAGRHAPRP